MRPYFRLGGRNFDRNFCGGRAATHVAEKCCHMMRTRAPISQSEINFLIFLKSAGNSDFLKKRPMCTLT